MACDDGVSQTTVLNFASKYLFIAPSALSACSEVSYYGNLAMVMQFNYDTASITTVSACAGPFQLIA